MGKIIYFHTDLKTIQRKIQAQRIVLCEKVHTI